MKKDKTIEITTVVGIALVEAVSICGAWSLASALGLGLLGKIMLGIAAGVVAPFALATVVAIPVAVYWYWLDWREARQMTR